MKTDFQFHIPKSFNIEPQYNEDDLKIINEVVSHKDIGFLSCLSNTELRESSKKVYKKFSHKRHFIQLGIGGSALGPEMLIKALDNNSEVEFSFINNVDAQEISNQLKRIKNIDEVLIYVVSKSGGTAETLAGFIACLNVLKDHFNNDFSKLKDFVAICTDKENGDLRKFATANEIETLVVPPDVGGRFSVLTPVGFLPALFAGINIDQLTESAKQFGNELIQNNQSTLISTSSIVLQLLKKHQIDQTVLMPYSSKLKELSNWFVQLWAESLGKKDFQGNRVGFTPIPAYGSTDQHSQMQLFMEGPKNKFFIFIQVENSEVDISLDNQIDLPNFQLLKNTSMHQLMTAEYLGATRAMEENELPQLRVKIERINEESIGKLVIFFELLTALVGTKQNLNPFDQPGVELGKIYTKEILSKN